MAELEERMDYLEEALNRLRGRLTGGKRRNLADPEGAESSEVDRKPEIAPQVELDRWQLLKQAKARRS